MSVKLLAEHHLEFQSLKGGFTGLSRSTLVKMPHCWKSHVTAHYITLNGLDLILSRLVGFSFFSSFPFIFNTGPEMTIAMGESSKFRKS